VAWLIAYPLSGWLGSELGLATALVTLGAATLAIAAATARLWPAHDPAELSHMHTGLSPSHPHIRSGAYRAVDGAPAIVHSHRFHIDDLHPRWPSPERP